MIRAFIQTFGENLDLCLRLTGSKIEAFSMRCNLSHHMLKGFKNKLGRLNERDLAVMCETLGVPREHLLHRYQSPTAAQGAFEEKPPVPGLSWDVDGLITTDSATGQTFNLGDETLRQEIVGRVIRLCPAGLTLDELLVKCQIEQPSSWLDDGQLEESDIEAFAEYFKVTEYVFLSGEGLVLPEPEEAIEDEVLPALPTDTTSEPPHAEVLEAEVGAVPLAEEPAAPAVVGGNTPTNP